MIIKYGQKLTHQKNTSLTHCSEFNVSLVMINFRSSGAELMVSWRKVTQHDNSKTVWS